MPVPFCPLPSDTTFLMWEPQPNSSTPLTQGIRQVLTVGQHVTQHHQRTSITAVNHAEVRAGHGRSIQSRQASDSAADDPYLYSVRSSSTSCTADVPCSRFEPQKAKPWTFLRQAQIKARHMPNSPDCDLCHTSLHSGLSSQWW